MEEYKPNKFNASPAATPQKEEKRVQQVAKGTTKKQSRVRKLRDAFLPEDVASIRSYIFTDVMVPYIKRTIDDIFHVMLYGSTYSKSSSSKLGSSPSYRDYYDSGKKAVRSTTSSVYSFDYVELASRGDAELVLEQMRDIVEKYGVATVADMYDLVGQAGSYTDRKYGWTDLRPARIERSRDGFIVVCPRPVAL